jgi:hypothetical protein
LILRHLELTPLTLQEASQRATSLTGQWHKSLKRLYGEQPLKVAIELHVTSVRPVDISLAEEQQTSEFRRLGAEYSG